MELLLQLDEAVVSLLCECDVSQHCCHSVRSHRCCLPTAQTFIVIKLILDWHQKLIPHHRQRDVTTHVLRNNQPLRLPTGRAYASVARGLHPATQESLWSFKCNITDTIIHKTCVTALYPRVFHWKIVLTYFWRPAFHGPTPPDIKGHSD